MNASAALLACALGALALWGCRGGPAECDVEEVAAARSRLEDLSARFEDTERLAGVTSRIALDGPVGKLQDLKREAAAVRVPPCVRRTHYLLVERMDLVLSGFMLFMADVGASSTVALASETGKELRQQFGQALDDVSLCAPECPHLEGWTPQRELARRAARRRQIEAAREKQAEEERARKRRRELDAAIAEEERVKAATAARRERIVLLRDEMRRWHPQYRAAIHPLVQAVGELNVSGTSPYACARLKRHIELTRHDRRIQGAPDEDVRAALSGLFQSYSRIAEVCTDDPTLREAQAKVVSAALARLGRALGDYELDL